MGGVDKALSPRVDRGFEHLKNQSGSVEGKQRFRIWRWIIGQGHRPSLQSSHLFRRLAVNSWRIWQFATQGRRILRNPGVNHPGSMTVAIFDKLGCNHAQSHFKFLNKVAFIKDTVLLLLQRSHSLDPESEITRILREEIRNLKLLVDRPSQPGTARSKQCKSQTPGNIVGPTRPNHFLTRD